MIAEELLAQLILFVLDRGGLEHAAGLLGLPALLLDLKDDLRLRRPRKCLDALSDELLLLRLVPHQSLCRGNIGDRVHPDGKFVRLADHMLLHGRSADSKSREIVFTHGDWDGGPKSVVADEDGSDAVAVRSNGGEELKAIKDWGGLNKKNQGDQTRELIHSNVSFLRVERKRR